MENGLVTFPANTGPCSEFSLTVSPRHWSPSYMETDQERSCLWEFRKMNVPLSSVRADGFRMRWENGGGEDNKWAPDASEPSRSLGETLESLAENLLFVFSSIWWGFKKEITLYLRCWRGAKLAGIISATATETAIRLYLLITVTWSAAASSVWETPPRTMQRD